MKQRIELNLFLICIRSIYFCLYNNMISGLNVLLRFWISHVTRKVCRPQECTLQSLQILYRSSNYIVVNKQYDTKINCDLPKPEEITVEKQLCHLCPELIDPSVRHSFRFIHRLDYSTSGVLCLALNKEAAFVVYKAFESQLVEKYYLALLHGHLEEHFVTIDKAIGTDTRPEFSHCMCTSDHEYCERPRRAITQLQVLELGMYKGKPASKVLLKPITGRRHQLRVHCHHLKHIIVGDFTYSNRKDILPHRMFLHAFKLVIPMGFEKIDVCTEDPFSHNDKSNKWVPTKCITALDENVFGKFPKINTRNTAIKL